MKTQINLEAPQQPPQQPQPPLPPQPFQETKQSPVSTFAPTSTIYPDSPLVDLDSSPAAPVTMEVKSTSRNRHPPKSSKLPTAPSTHKSRGVTVCPSTHRASTVNTTRSELADCHAAYHRLISESDSDTSGNRHHQREKSEPSSNSPRPSRSFNDEIPKRTISSSTSSITSTHIILSSILPWDEYSAVFRYELMKKSISDIPAGLPLCGCGPYIFFFETLTTKERKLLCRLKHEASVMYDRTNQAHERLLYRYWTNSYPDEPPVNTISPRWRLMGFQSNDPRTDFRGGSILSLYCMVLFQTKYPKDFERISQELWEFDEYPFSAGFINVVYMLILFFKLNSEPGYIEGGNEVASSRCMKGFAALGVKEFGAFGHLFASCCICLHNHWRYLSRNLAKRRLSDFSESMRFCKKRMIECLNSKPTKLEELADIYARVV